MEIRNEFQTAEWVDRQMAALLSANEWAPDTDRGLERLRHRREKVHRQKRHSAWIMICALAVAAGVLSFPGTRAYAHRCVQACVVETSRLGQYVLARLNPGEAPQSMRHGERREAPDFLLTDAHGRAIQLSAFRGKVVVLNFWATWCPPCLVEIPWFIDFQRQYGSRGFSVIGVSLDEDGWNTVRPFLQRQGINYPIVLGGNQIAQAYEGLESLPTTLIIDRNGGVAATHMGLVARSVYESDIESALAEP
jgi:cytochrome c biogenesis protein CcmG/thiol:disulfide interchange protein DsbE